MAEYKIATVKDAYIDMMSNMLDRVGHGLLDPRASTVGDEKVRGILEQRIQALAQGVSTADRSVEKVYPLFETLATFVNWLRVAQLPVNLDEPPIDYDSLQPEDIKRILARMALLSGDFDLLLPRILGTAVDRYDKTHNPSCKQCLAGCCLGLEMDLRLKSAYQLWEAGTIHTTTLFDNLGFANEDVIADLNRRLRGNQSSQVLNHSVEETGVYELVGYCGHVNRSNFQCDYYRLRPEACRQFVLGGDDCKRRFVSRDSMAAKVILKIVNDAEPILAQQARRYGAVRDTTPFIHVHDISVYRHE